MSVMDPAVAELFQTDPCVPVTFQRRDKMAGAVVAACAALDSEFRGTAKGWRIIIAKVRRQREMVAEDIGIEPT